MRYHNNPHPLIFLSVTRSFSEEPSTIKGQNIMGHPEESMKTKQKELMRRAMTLSNFYFYFLFSNPTKGVRT